MVDPQKRAFLSFEIKTVNKDNLDVCMWPVCSRSSSQLRICICTMLKDAAMLSWLGLVKQVFPRKDSCWLASAIVAVGSSSPGEGRTVLKTIVLPRICSSSSSSAGAARGSPQLAAEGAARQPTAAAAATSGSNSSRGKSSIRAAARSSGAAIGGSPQQQLQQLHSSGQRAKYCPNILRIYAKSLHPTV